MTALATILFSSLPATANYQSRFDVTVKIERSYDAKIEFQDLNRSWSLYGCAIEEIQIFGHDPVTLKKRAVNVSLYRTRGVQAEQKAVIILPPTGGVNILDQGYANELCSSGISVALVSGWEHQADVDLDFSMHNNGALRALAATRHVVEFLHFKNFQSIGILGTSIGAIASTLALEFEPRISAVALIVGSARFADVIADSDEAGATNLRRQRMAALGLKNEAEYKQALRDAVFIEPSNFLDRTKGKKVLVISASADSTVPSLYQHELAQALKAEPHIQLPGNHVQAIKEAFCSHRGEIADFFSKTLGAQHEIRK